MHHFKKFFKENFPKWALRECFPGLWLSTGLIGWDQVLICLHHRSNCLLTSTGSLDGCIICCTTFDSKCKSFDCTETLHSTVSLLWLITPVTPRLRLYCDHFLDQIAADHSKVPVRSQCGHGWSHWSLNSRCRSPHRPCSSRCYCTWSALDLQSHEYCDYVFRTATTKWAYCDNKWPDCERGQTVKGAKRSSARCR